MSLPISTLEIVAALIDERDPAFSSRGQKGRTLLLIDPVGSDAAKLGQKIKLGLLVEKEADLADLWAASRQVSFESRPLVLGGSPEAASNVLPFQFDVVVWLDPKIDPAQRIDTALQLLAPGGYMVRPVHEVATNETAATAVVPLDVTPQALCRDSVDVVRLAAKSEIMTRRRFEERDWTEVKVAFDAYHESSRGGVDRDSDLQEALLRIWSDAVVKDAKPNHWPWGGPTKPAPLLFLEGWSWPRISVVVPTFNQGHFIEETLLSLIHQGYANLEIIVVDGGSTDQTLEVVNSYRSHLSHVISERDRGQSHAINKGMKLASGDILTWLNSDDMLAEGALHGMALAFAGSGADMVAGICRTHTDHVYDSEHLTSCADGTLPIENILDLDGGWNAGQFFYQPEVFFTRQIWEKAGASVREDLYYSMDYELWLRFAACKAKIHVIGRTIALFRRHDQQKTHVANRFKAELLEVRDAFVSETGAKIGQNPFGTSTRKLSFCFINDIGFEYGAGIAHRRLADSLVAAGHRVQSIHFLQHPADAGEPLPTAAVLTDAVAATDCDIVVLGNIHHAQPEPSLFEGIFRRWPTVIVVHDFWWFTGRCAYTHGCRKLETGCDASCPTPEEYPRLAPEQIADAWFQKRNLLQNNPNVIIAANSSWTRDFVQDADASIAGRLDQIRLGIDPINFVPRDKKTARLALGLPGEDFIVLISTTSLSEPRKGVMPVIQLLAKQGIPDVKVVILGHVSEKERETLPGFCILPGYVKGQEQVLLYYAAADLFVGASREETFGQAFAEAGALGTPVVAHGVTGVKDAVADGISGLLTRTGSTSELVRLIVTLKDRPSIARRIRGLGPLYYENEHSIEATYRGFHQMLQRAGLLNRFGVRPNINFVPRENRLRAKPGSDLATRENGRTWIAGAGVSWREKPSPEHGHPRSFNWLQGPSSEVVLLSERSGRQRVVMEYQNVLFEEQLVKISVNGTIVLDRALHRTVPHILGAMSFLADLREGRNDMKIEFGHWHNAEGDSRKLALIMTGLSRL